MARRRRKAQRRGVLSQLTASFGGSKTTRRRATRATRRRLAPLRALVRRRASR